MTEVQRSSLFLTLLFNSRGVALRAIWEFQKCKFCNNNYFAIFYPDLSRKIGQIWGNVSFKNYLRKQDESCIRFGSPILQGPTTHTRSICSRKHHPIVLCQAFWYSTFCYLYTSVHCGLGCRYNTSDILNWKPWSCADITYLPSKELVLRNGYEQFCTSWP